MNQNDAEKIVVFSTTPGLTQRCRAVFSKRGYDRTAIYELTTVQALEQAEHCIRAGIRVIICRGGPADYLRRHLEIPIVDVRHSFLSVFLTMRKLKGHYERAALIGYGRICETGRRYNSYLQCDSLRIYQVDSDDQLEKSLEQALLNGAQIIIGGYQVQSLCLDREIPYCSIEPDDSEVDQALDEALYSLRIEEERSQQLGVLSTVFNSVGEGIVCIDRDGKILQINRVARSLLHCEVGALLTDLIPGNRILQTAQSGEDFFGETLSVRGNSLICACQAIRLQGRAAGAVLTLQEENTIRSLDSRIRKRELGRGHIAKKDFGDIIGESPALVEAKKVAQRYARSGSTVLITGETGTGKELFAQGIHNYSDRRHEPFVAINCAALPQNILESELFGYVRGAFTGANNEGKAGIFELAHKGTVFLDEISEMSTDVQVKLLRVLQEKEVTRIGDDKVVPIDVRILAACNKDLPREVAEGRFREDLYYRVCVLELQIPPLRGRAGDIPVLVRHFMRGRKALTTRAEELMSQYPWPGNIRQLSNVTERLDVLCDNDLITEEEVRQVLRAMPRLPQSTCNDAADNPASLNEMEERMIREAMRQAGGNREQAARALGMSKTTLWRRIQQLGL